MNPTNNRFFVLALVAVVLLALAVIDNHIAHTWQLVGGAGSLVRMNCYTGEVQALAEGKWISFSGMPVLHVRP